MTGTRRRRSVPDLVEVMRAGDSQDNPNRSGVQWYAVYALPQNEHAVVRHLEARQIECFLPTWESIQIWKNRQRVTVIHPLFPCYLFVRINHGQRSAVLQCPGVVRIVGNSKGPAPILDAEIDFLRSEFCHNRIGPFLDVVVGEQVRIKSGAMQGVRGTLVRNGDGLRFVVSLGLIDQHAAVEVAADELEPAPYS